MTSRDRSIVAVVAVLIVAVGGWFLLVQPTKHHASKLQSEIGAQRMALTAAQATVQQGLADEKQYKTYAKQLKSAQAAVPSDDQVPELITELQAAATKTHVAFQQVTLSGAAATTGATSSFPSDSFSLQFTGGYFAVADLLGKVSDFVHADNGHFSATGRLISMNTVTLAPGSGAASSSAQTKASASNPVVTASVTATDYDIPSALLGGATSSTAGASAAPTSATTTTASAGA